MKSLDEGDPTGEELVEAMQKGKVDAAVELNCGETGLVGCASDLVGIDCVEDAYGAPLRREDAA